MPDPLPPSQNPQQDPKSIQLSTDDDLDRPASAQEEVAEASVVQTVTPEIANKIDPYAALRLPALRYYLLGWFLMVIGGQMTSLALRVQLYDRTGSEAAIGWLGMMSALPIILFSLPAGAMADRRDRRKIVLTATTGTLFGIGLLALLSYLHAPLWTIYATQFAIGTTQALGYPARSAIMPTIVPRHLLSNAVTWNSTIFQTASILGPIVAGTILDYASTPVAFATHAILTVIFLLFVWKLEGGFTPPQQAPAASDPKSPPQSRWRDLTEGIHFITGNKIIFATVLLDLLAVILGGVVYVLPVFAKDILHVSKTQLGFLSAGEAIGSILMGLVIVYLPPFKRAGIAMLWAVAGFGLAIVIFGFSRNFYLSFAMLIFAGAMDNVSVVVRHTLVNVLAPDSMRGRINAVNTIFIGSSNELGGFRAGTMASWLGPAHSVIVGGIGTLASVVYVAFSFKSVRQLGSLQELKELKK